MSRIFVMLPLLLLAACSRVPQPAEVVPPRQQRPAWLKEGIVIAGNWETLGHSLRSGLSTADEEEEFQAERTEEVARKLKALGVTLVTTSFYKGGGLKTEAGETEATRQFTPIAHGAGLKVGGYIGGTLLYEKLYLEKSRAREWREVNESGHPIYYPGGQTHRVAPLTRRFGGPSWKHPTEPSGAICRSASRTAVSRLSCLNCGPTTWCCWAPMGDSAIYPDTFTRSSRVL
jgi:hypothetical protein